MLKSLPVSQVEQPAAAREGTPSKVLAEPESGKGGIPIRSSIGQPSAKPLKAVAHIWVLEARAGGPQHCICNELHWITIRR